MPVLRLEMSFSELTSAFTNVMVPLEVVALILLSMVLAVSIKYGVYADFPGTLFLWLLPVDIFYGLLTGPVRWFPSSSVRSVFGDVYSMSAGMCGFSAFVDTFFQLASLYINTAIVAVVFYMVFSTTNFHGDRARELNWYARVGFWLCTLPLALAAAASSTSRNAGWCIADSLVVVVKQIIWYVALLFQLTMVIPTQYQIYKTSLRNFKALSKGTYMRFCGIILTQVIGLIPVMLVEFMAFSRRRIPRALIYSVAVGFPLAHILDALLLSIKALPLMAPFFQSLFRSWDSSKDTKPSDSNDHHSKEHANGSNEGSNHPEHKERKKFRILRTKHEKKSFPAASATKESDKHKGVSKEEPVSFMGAGSEEDTGVKASPQMGTAKARTARKVKETPHPRAVESVVGQLSGEKKRRYIFFGKILFSVVFPMIALIGVGTTFLIQQRDAIAVATELQNNLGMVPLVASLHHKLQSERAVAGLFITNNGTVFSEVYYVQMKATDKEARKLLKYMKSYQGKLRSSGVYEDISTAVGNLSVIRSHIVGFQWSLVETRNAYDNCMLLVFGLIEEIAALARTNTITTPLLAYSGFVDAKVYLGAERSFVSGLIATSDSSIDVASYITYQTLITNISVNADNFRSFADSHRCKTYNALDARAQSELLKFRETILVRRENPGDIDVAMFIATVTDVIDEHRNFLDVLESDLINYAETEMQVAFDVVIGYTFALVAILYFVGVLLYVTGTTVGSIDTHLRFLKAKHGKSQDLDKMEDLVEGKHHTTCTRLGDRVRISFTWQIFLIAMIPTMALLGLFLSQINTKIIGAQEASSHADNIRVCGLVTETVHHSGLESAAALLYIISDTAETEANYTKMFPLLDERWSELSQFLVRSFSNEVVKSSESYREVFHAAASLPELREKILNRSVTLHEVGVYYEGFREILLNLVKLLAGATNAEAIDHQLFAYIQYAHSKKYMSRYRYDTTIATTQGWMSSDLFDDLIHHRAGFWVTLANQMVYSTSTEQRETAELLQSPSREVLSKWDLVLNKNSSIALNTISSEEFFLLSSEFIDLMEALEDSRAESMFARAALDIQANQITRSALSVVFSVIATLSLCMLFVAHSRVGAFSKMMLEYLKKEESCIRAKEALNTEKVPHADIEMTEVKRKKRHRRGTSAPTEHQMGVDDLLQISDLLLCDAHEIPESPGGKAALDRNQEVLDFYAWISSIEGFVECNRWIYLQSTDPNLITFWKDIEDVKSLAHTATARREPELEELLYKKAEAVYNLHIRSKMKTTDPVGPNHLRTLRKKVRTRSMFQSRPHLEERASALGIDLPSPAVGSPRTSSGGVLLPDNRARSTGSVASPDATTDVEPQSSVVKTDSDGTPHVQYRKPRLSAILADPTQLQLLKQFCRQARCEENVEFLLAVMAFRKSCGREVAYRCHPQERSDGSSDAPSTKLSNRRGFKVSQLMAVPSPTENSGAIGTPPVVAAQAGEVASVDESKLRQPNPNGEKQDERPSAAMWLMARDIYEQFLSDSGPSRVNVIGALKTQVQQVLYGGGASGNGNGSEIELEMPGALENCTLSLEDFSRVFDGPYTEVRRMVMHNILGNMLKGSGTLSSAVRGGGGGGGGRERERKPLTGGPHSILSSPSKNNGSHSHNGSSHASVRKLYKVGQPKSPASRSSHDLH